MNKIQIIPSVDILNGKVVRLFQGDYQKITEYPESPIDVIKKFMEHGFDFIHIVNLDGARSQESKYTQSMIEQIFQLKCKIQIGGGIRSLDMAQMYKSVGAKVVLGTVCVKNPEVAMQIVEEVGQQNVTLAFDCKDNHNGDYDVMVNGWQEGNKTHLKTMLELYSKYQISVLCTDIAVDGTLTSPNFSLYRWIKKHYPQFVLQASGGVASVEDVIKLHEDHIDGVIVGRALHHGMISLKQLRDINF